MDIDSSEWIVTSDVIKWTKVFKQVIIQLFDSWNKYWSLLGNRIIKLMLRSHLTSNNFWPFLFIFQNIETRPLDSKLSHQHAERSAEVAECPVRPRDISPRFIVNLPTKKQSGKNMKLRKSRFRFGSFAFGHSTTNLASTSTHSPPSLPTYTPTPDPFFVHPELRLKEESKFRSSSTASLIRRSNSR